jgi:hypothetical protein
MIMLYWGYLLGYVRVIMVISIIRVIMIIRAIRVIRIIWVGVSGSLLSAQSHAVAKHCLLLKLNKTER